MEPAELIEGLAMIAVIIAWWPYLFLQWNGPVYSVCLYVGSFVILVAILLRRLKRMREGLKYSRHMMDQQEEFRKATQGPLNLESQPPQKEPKKQKGEK
jgi:hypothetical protein